MLTAVEISGEKEETLFVFLDLEKVFYRIHIEVIKGEMTKLDIEEWLITAVVIMYRNSSSMIRINKTVVEKFDVKVAVHQGSVLSPCLFVINFEALLRECRSTLPCDMLYVDDLVIIVESLVELGTRYTA